LSLWLVPTRQLCPEPGSCPGTLPVPRSTMFWLFPVSWPGPTCILRHDTKALPRGPKGILPFKEPTPVDQEGDPLSYREKEETVSTHLSTFSNTQTTHVYIKSPLFAVTAANIPCSSYYVIISHYMFIWLTFILLLHENRDHIWVCSLLYT
jgi:hypothetical protein